MKNKRSGLSLRTKAKLVVALLVGAIVLAMFGSCAAGSSGDGDSKPKDPKAITKIVDGDGNVVDVPPEAVKKAVEADVIEHQHPKGGHVDAHGCYGEDPEHLGSTSEPVKAEAGAVVRCQLKMINAKGHDVDQYQVGRVVGFEKNDPASVVIEF